MAEHGAALTRARSRASERIVAELERAFVAHHRRDAPSKRAIGPAGRPTKPELQRCAAVAAGARPAPRERRIGPHRDDLVIDPRRLRRPPRASQGEHRAITMALKMAELACIARRRAASTRCCCSTTFRASSTRPNGALIRVPARDPGQIFLTTTRPSNSSHAAVGSAASDVDSVGARALSSGASSGPGTGSRESESAPPEGCPKA